MRACVRACLPACVRASALVRAAGFSSAEKVLTSIGIRSADACRRPRPLLAPLSVRPPPRPPRPPPPPPPLPLSLWQISANSTRPNVNSGSRANHATRHASPRVGARSSVGVPRMRRARGRPRVAGKSAEKKERTG